MKLGFLRLNDVAAKEIASRFSDALTKKLVKKIKELPDEDTGSFRVVMSTSDQDRQGESVNQDGLDFTNYMNNPVVLWGHDYGSLPIGICTGISREGDQTIAEGKFAPADANPFAQQVRRLYDLGMQRAVSVGFIPKEVDENGNTTNGEVLEFSFVPIPANPYALTLNQVEQSGLRLGMLAAKGVDFELETKGEPISNETKKLIIADLEKAGKGKEAKLMAKKLKLEYQGKAAEVGAACQLDDGTPGTLQKNPDDPEGPLVCMPDKNASKGDQEEDAPHANDDEAGDNGDEPSNQSAEGWMRDYLESEHPTHAKAVKEAIDEYRGSMKDAMGASYDKDEMATKCKEALKGVKAKCKEEMGRHLVTVQKMIDAFTESSKAKAADREPSEGDDEEGAEDDHDNSQLAEELNNVMSEEFEDHHSFIQKAIEDYHKEAIERGEANGDHSTTLAKSVRDEQDRHKEAIKEAINEFTEKSKETADRGSGDDEGGNPTNNSEKKPKKGQVADNLSKENQFEQKWSKLQKVYDIFDAFIMSYLDENTPVEDFDNLLKETVGLLSGNEAKSVSEKKILSFIGKSGAKLSKANKEALMKAVGHLKDAMEAHEGAMDGTMETHKHLKLANAALKELQSNPQDGGSEDEESPADEPGEKKPSKNQRSNSSGAKGQGELEKHLADRDLRNTLKIASTAISDVLEVHNRIHREKKLNRNWR